MTPVVLRRQAQLDIEAAALWYDDQSPGLGDHFLDEITAGLDRIAEGPRQFPVIEADVRRALIRRFPYGVYFIESPTGSTVLAVLHLRRRPGAWRAR